MKVKINFSGGDIDGITANLQVAWRETVAAAHNASDRAMDAEIYYWPGETRRKNGLVVSSPRDIVDTGDLKDVFVTTTRGFVSTMAWRMPYAYFVHEGTGKMLGRPWTRVAIGGGRAPYNNPWAILNFPMFFADRARFHLRQLNSQSLNNLRR